MDLDFSKIFNEKIKEVQNFVDSSVKIIGGTSQYFFETLNTKANALQIAAQDMGYNNRLRKYNPLFMDEYTSEEYNVPNMIRIVDDAVRKGIDVCEGSIGWTSKEKGVEIFHIYDEALKLSKINFVPAPIVDDIYLVDPLDRTTFISIESYYSNIQQSKIAELQNIAFCLGAKHYRVEMVEFSAEKYSGKHKSNSQLNVTNSDVDVSLSSSKSVVQKSLAVGNFSNSNEPIRPSLKWFSTDNNIKNLIEMRCSETNKHNILDITIELSNSSSANISKSMAANIKAVAGGFGIKSNFEENSDKDYNSKLLYYLEF